MFVTSPVTAAAIITRVKKDLEWLAARSDRVAVLAHSQGAAVSYRAIQQHLREGYTPKELDMLFTYGSGLQKLFVLEHLESDIRLWTILGVSSVVLSVILVAIFFLSIGGVISWWALLLGLLVNVAFQFVPMFLPLWEFVPLSPAHLGIRWLDCYASDDLVPNGPADSVANREVVNRRSIFTDHTSYWSNPDDFIAAVATLLLENSDMRIEGTLDEEWLRVASARRQWRVTWLSRCRAVTGVMCLSIVFWPRDVLERVGSYLRVSTVTAVPKVTEEFAAWAPGIPVPDWLIGAGGLMLGTYLMFLVALFGWNLWERQELRRFFLGGTAKSSADPLPVGWRVTLGSRYSSQPYSSALRAGWVFALGWTAVFASAPTYVLAQGHLHWHGFLYVLWAPSILAGWSAWKVNKSGRGPGTAPEWGRIILAHAERVLLDEKRNRIDALREAKLCFEDLEVRDSGSDEWIRAVLGRTRAVEELAKSDLGIRDDAPRIYREAIDALKRAGRDASEVQSRLEKTKIEPSN
jgi:hypothetical protein